MLLDIVTALDVLPGGSAFGLCCWGLFLGTMWLIRESRGAR
jgi:hypothetical protein